VNSKTGDVRHRRGAAIRSVARGQSHATRRDVTRRSCVSPVARITLGLTAGEAITTWVLDVPVGHLGEGEPRCRWQSLVSVDPGRGSGDVPLCTPGAGRYQSRRPAVDLVKVEWKEKEPMVSHSLD